MKSSGRFLLLAFFGALLLTACGGSTAFPQPRGIIVFSGERISADPERMEAIDLALRPHLEDIDRNPSFVISLNRQVDAAYPWTTLDIRGDTAHIAVERTAGDAQTPFQIYAHLRLMQERSELGEWLPEVRDRELSALETEEAILEYVADVWLLGRSVFDTQPHGPLDELIYARDRGFLRPFILATQPDRFDEERVALAEENPEWEAELTDFFQRTFERDGPGYLPSGEEEAEGQGPPGEGPPGGDEAGGVDGSTGEGSEASPELRGVSLLR
ncbi:MAG: hypothetical protein EA422_02870 [Gemmatimonadales bacterium]|nr:MAG: hypothetical protein EA422_02870 [Gemmatimonadales bacterium]